jgi:hypothetical protein
LILIPVVFFQRHNERTYSPPSNARDTWRVIWIVTIVLVMTIVILTRVVALAKTSNTIGRLE